MIYILILSIIFIIAVMVFATILIIKYTKLVNENVRISHYIRKITNVVHSVRYGNLKARIEGESPLCAEKLTEGLNSLFESILDRDNMIQEHILKEKELNSLKSDFIATLTHDLKVPIIAQDNTFDLFLNGVFGEITDVQRQAIKNLKISNMDQKHLIEALLETFKLEQTKVEVVKTQNVDITKIVNEIIEQINPVAQAHDRVINFNCGKNIFADIDLFKFKRVVQNLILNALSHSIHSKCTDVYLDSQVDTFTVAVKDYGCGIKSEDIEKIFEKFYSPASKFTKASTGLGLYLSNKLVKLHGGKIRVESVCADDNLEGTSGTTFYVTLPLK